MDLQLAGKTALITGSSSGIGVAIAQMLAAEGVAVVVNGRNAERCEKVAAGIRAAGGKAGVAVGEGVVEGTGDGEADDGGTGVVEPVPKIETASDPMDEGAADFTLAPVGPVRVTEFVKRRFQTISPS